MKVVYFGSDVFLSCFEYFAREHQLLALYTYHNDEDYFSEYAIVNRARALGLPVHYEDITPEEITRYFTQDGCQLFFVAEYNRVLPIPEQLPQFRGINTHSSLLPQGRSYYPIEAAMERGLSRTGVTMHILAPQLDHGDILAQREVTITPQMDSVDIYLQCAAHARQMVEQLCADLDGAWAQAQPQTQRLPYWKRPDARAMTLHHGMTRGEAAAVFRRYNSMTQLLLGGRWYYVTALSPGTAALEVPERLLSPTRLLYQVPDGHLRLQIHPMEVDV